MQKKRSEAAVPPQEALPPELEGKDLSILKPSIPLGVTNIRQILTCLASGTTEMKDLILNECKLQFECKACRCVFLKAKLFVEHRQNRCRGNAKQAANPPNLADIRPPHFTELVQPPPPPPRHNKRKSTPNKLFLPVFSTFDLTEDVSQVITPDSSRSSSELPVQKTDPQEKPPSDTDGSSLPKEPELVSPSANGQPTEKSRHDRDGTCKENIVPSSKLDSPFIQDLVDKASRNKRKLQSCQGKSRPKKTLNEIINSRLNDKNTYEDEDDAEVPHQPAPFKMFSKKETDPAAVKVSTNNNRTAANLASKSYTIFDQYLRQLKQKEKQAQGLAFHLTPIPGNCNAMFQVQANPGETELKRPTRMKENKPEDKPVVVVISKPVVDKTSKRLASKKQQQQQRANSGPPSTPFQCDTCKNFFCSAKSLQIHKRKIHAPNRLHYSCPLCQTTFVQIYSACRHLETVHKKAKDQVNRLREVMKTNAFTKPEDSGQPKNPSAASDDGPSLHRCPHCSKTYEKKQQLATHTRFCPKSREDEEESPPPTKTTPKRSDTKESSSSSGKKLKKTNEKPRIKEEKLDDHHTSRPKRINTNKKMDKDFVNSQTYFKASTPSKTSKDPSGSPGKKSAKSIESKVLSLVNLQTLECIKCKKNFSTFSNLRRHTAIHIGWKRFFCLKCQQQFYNRFDCREHISRMHPDEPVDSLVGDLPQKAAFSDRNAIVALRQKKSPKAT